MRGGNRNKGAAHNRFRHGMTGTSTYRTWSAMKARCFRKTSPDYKNYGARGITVCDGWMAFEGFVQDMGERPSPEMTLERKDADKDYAPENCEWANRTTQSRNRRYVKLSVEAAEQIKALRADGWLVKDLARQFNTSESNISRVTNGRTWK